MPSRLSELLQHIDLALKPNTTMMRPATSREHTNKIERH
jgi:hypothetical protein